MADEQRQEFERRVLALIRHSLAGMDEDHPGYEIGDFVLTFEYFEPPTADEQVGPWAGGRYGGWWPSGMTFGSSDGWHVDARLLREALEYTERRYQEGRLDKDDEEGEEDGEEAE